MYAGWCPRRSTELPFYFIEIKFLVGQLDENPGPYQDRCIPTGNCLWMFHKDRVDVPSYMDFFLGVSWLVFR